MTVNVSAVRTKALTDLFAADKMQRAEEGVE